VAARAANARAAGLDGVELHGAFGYLVDQFLQDGTNRRTDAYGGSPEARTRFLREVTQALVDVWGADPDLPRRLAGGGPFNAPDPSTFYGEGPGGYTDYPALGLS
jgi:2,4-dienoyl-CoA reductase-like NADH-dependent reductase (Old Yellow Enzyme family)